jgi:GntR family transcriptional regulator
LRRPRWQVMYDDLRTQIDQGDYMPGDRLPTENDLMERYGCSRDTARRAFSQLEQAGLVATRRGAGRVVRQHLELYFDASKFERVYADDPDQGRDQWGQDVAAQNWQARQEVTVGWEKATRPIARWLDTEIRTRLLRRRRIRMVRQDSDMPWVPVVIADSWFPHDIAVRTDADGEPPLLIAENITKHGGIMRSIGIRQTQFVDEIRARMPSDDEIQLLALQPGTPVLEFARVGMDETRRRIRVIVNVIDAASQYLKYVLDVPQPDTSTTPTQEPQ